MGHAALGSEIHESQRGLSLPLAVPYGAALHAAGPFRPYAALLLDDAEHVSMYERFSYDPQILGFVICADARAQSSGHKIIELAV